MAIELTSEQEARIAAVLGSGAYDSAVDVLDAALAAVEAATAAPQFEGPDEELEALLLQGLSTKELSEDEFWDSLRSQTGKLIASVRRT